MDIYLKLMMEGKIGDKPQAINRFDLAIEKAAEEYANETLEGVIFNNQFITLNMKKTQLIEEYKESMKLTELKRFIENSFDILVKEGLKYIGHERYENLIKSFSGIDIYLEKFDLNTGQTFKEIFHIDDSILESIFQIAISKYSEEQYSSSMSLFILLTTLASNHPDYWYRLGIAAQSVKNLNLAVEAYEMANKLDPEMLGPWLFSVECNLLLKDFNKAQLNFEKSKTIFEANPELDVVWKEIIDRIEDHINLKSY